MVIKKIRKAKKEVHTKLAEEAIDMLMMAGIAFVIVLFGVNWFNMKYAWFGVIQQVSAQTGFASSATGVEVGAMLSALGNSFPFNFLFGTTSFASTLTVAILMTILGFGAKLWTTRSKGKLIKDVGRSIYIPALVGLLCIFLLQLMAVLHIDDYMLIHGGMRPTLTSSFFVWDTYGQLFVFGAAVLVIGSVLKLIADQNRFAKLKIAANTMVTGSFFLIGYYILVRLLSFQIILKSSLGSLLSLFLISSQFSTYTLAFCVYFYVFGKELHKYGIAVMKHERKLVHLAYMKRQEQKMSEEYGAKTVHRPKGYPLHPKDLGSAKDYGDARREHGHAKNTNRPTNKYIEPRGHYKSRPKGLNPGDKF